MDSHSILDEMVNEDSVQVLKAALPYLPLQSQSFVSIFAKFLELENTIHLFQSSRANMQLSAQSAERSDPLEMLTACSKVCRGPMKDRLDSVINTLVMLQMFDLSVSSDDTMPKKGGTGQHE